MMPKTINTRKQRADELLKRLAHGPHYGRNFDGSAFTPEQATQAFQNWSYSWILFELVDLIPELKQKFTNERAVTAYLKALTDETTASHH